MDTATPYRHVMEAVFRRPWAIMPEKLAAIGELVRMRIDGFRMAPEAVAEIVAAASRPPNPSKGVTAVIPIYGTILYRCGPLEQMSGASSLQQVSRAFDAAMGDDRVKSIVLCVDSPGGEVSGVPEMAAKIHGARGVKPVTAVIDPLGCSAAYWLARAAEECVITPSGMCGSIGVYMLHEDDSLALEQEGVKLTFIEAPQGGHKTEGNPYQPLNADAEAFAQSQVDELYGWFVSDIARFSGQSEATVRGEQFGQGRVFLAKDAVSRKMVDRVATLEQVLARSGGAGNAIAIEGVAAVIEAPSPKAEAVEYDGQRAAAALAQFRQLNSL